MCVIVCSVCVCSLAPSKSTHHNPKLCANPTQKNTNGQHDTAGLETLKMGWCKVGGGDGAEALAQLLMFNTSLVQVG